MVPRDGSERSEDPGVSELSLDAPRDVRYRTRVALAFAGFVLVGIMAGGNGVLLPAQIAGYHVDKSTVGIQFFTFSAGYLLSGIGNGWLIRRFGTRRQLVLCGALLAATALVGGLRPPFVALAALQVTLGFGTGGIESGFNVYLSVLPRATALLNHLHAFFGVGALLGPVVAATMLATGLPWNSVYLLLGALWVPVVAGIAVAFPSAVPAAADEVRASTLTATLRRRAVWLAGIFLVVYVGVEISMGNWGYSFLVEERGQGTVAAGWAASGYWFGLTVGRFVLNGLAERVGLDAAGLMWACLAGTGAATSLVWLVPGGWAASGGLVLLGFFLGPIYPTTMAVVPRLVPASLVPTAVGVLVGLSVAGGSFFPWLSGALAERVGLWSLPPYLLALGVPLVACWWRIARRLGPEPGGAG
jgi:fucose permease